MADSGPRKPGNSKEVDKTDNDVPKPRLSFRCSARRLPQLRQSCHPQPKQSTTQPSPDGSGLEPAKFQGQSRRVWWLGNAPTNILTGSIWNYPITAANF